MTKVIEGMFWGFNFSFSEIIRIRVDQIYECIVIYEGKQLQMYMN